MNTHTASWITSATSNLRAAIHAESPGLRRSAIGAALRALDNIREPVSTLPPMPHASVDRMDLTIRTAEYVAARVEFLSTGAQEDAPCPDVPATVAPFAELLDDVAQQIHDHSPSLGQR